MSKIISQYFNNNYGYVSLATLGVLNIPLMLYVFNANEFAGDPFLLLVPFIVAMIIIGAGIIFNAIGTLIFKSESKINHFVQAFLSAVGLIIFFNDLFIPTQATALNGATSAIPESINLSLIEFIIALIIYTFLMVKFNNSKVRRLLVSVSSYAMALVFFLSLFVVYFEWMKSGDFLPDIKNISQQNKESPNVYFLWLDGMQNDYFIKSIKEDKQTQHFNNFTLYKNNISNYLYTLQSYQSFMSGTIYDGKDYKEWISDDRMRHAFKNHNYRLSSYGMPQYVSGLDNHQLKTEDVIKERLHMKHPYFSDFISLTLVRMTPNFLANESLLLGNMISEKLISYLYPKIENEVNTVDKGMYPYSGPITYQHLIADEKLRQDTGEFVLTQIIMPHAPYVMDKDCQYKPPKKSRSKQQASLDYLNQAKCAIKLLLSFINRLKELGRYDNSIIIIMSDHGSGWTGLMDDNKKGRQSKLNARYSTWNEPQLLKRAASLLMIKPAATGYNDELKLSTKETQLIDIVPTLFNLLNWKTDDEYDGRDILSPNNSKRDSVLTYFKPTTTPNFDDAEIYHINYDSVKGRTKLKFMESFNNYFFPNSKTIKERKKNKVKEVSNNRTDNISKKEFEN